MPYLTKVSSKLIIVRHSGDVICQELSDAAQEVEASIEPMNLPYLLVDVREVNSFPDPNEYLLWLQQRRRQSPLVERLSFVTNKVHSNTIEAIALEHIKRGINVRVFCGELEALKWLFQSREPSGSPS